ncbi:CHAD domain-containing protein [Chromobacterium paludis]|uniref:CHAD domain-containing protein n=2 Tax=Chromobacterium paludis TaxID=2605945 RepID=A0A5C1DER1_9NEIS|nr:CHAD domain-containing protein [Chromobacterium paludis]
MPSRAGIRLKPSRARPLALRARMTPRLALRMALLESLRHLSANLGGVREGDDPECVHQARVALRRLSAAGTAFRPLTRGEAWRSVLREAREWAGLLGAVRDLDVMLLETLPAVAPSAWAAQDLSALRKALEKRRAGMKARARAALAPARFDGWARRLLALANQDACIRDGSLPGRRGFAARSLNRGWKPVRRLTEQWDALSVEQRHELRKRAKKLRYAIEFFAHLYPGKRVERCLAPLQLAQQRLGALNDRAAACDMLAQCAAEWPDLQPSLGQLRLALTAENPEDESRARSAVRHLSRLEPFWQ